MTPLRLATVATGGVVLAALEHATGAELPAVSELAPLCGAVKNAILRDSGVVVFEVA